MYPIVMQLLSNSEDFLFSYVCHLNENSPQGTALVFSDAYSTQVHDNDMVRLFCLYTPILNYDVI